MKGVFYTLLCLLFLSGCSEQKNTHFDTVILNARVIDPETSTDEVLNVGVKGNQIVSITKDAITGDVNINASGKVLTPGFIDLHAHGQTNVENSYQAYDGVTTALELEVGVDTIQEFLAFREGKALLNYGASACQLAYRNKAFTGGETTKESIYNELTDSVAQKVLPENKFPLLKQYLIEALNAGAIGVGIPVGYLPKASVEEIEVVYSLAGAQNVPIFSHVREGGAIAFQQAVADAILNETQLHLCHINSMARKDISFCLNMVTKAQALGFPISAEFYPYTAANTELGSAIFNEGWEDRLGCSYEDLQWVATGERLTKETFEEYRKIGGSVIIHMMKEEWIKEAAQTPKVMVASDGGDFSPMGHPRSAGTFCKILRKYVREDQVLSLPEAIAKMTLLPAQVLESVVPEMKKRGRIQEGCFADLILFDPNTVEDKATFEKGFQKSEGMEYVWVNGEMLIKEGKLLPNVFPGKAIKSSLNKK